MIEKIEKIICKERGLKPEDLHVKSKKRFLSDTRYLVMYFYKKYNPYQKWIVIGNYYGFGHAGAIRAIDSVQTRKETEPLFRKEIKRLERLFEDKGIHHTSLKTLSSNVFRLESIITEAQSLLKSIVNEINYIEIYPGINKK